MSVPEKNIVSDYYQEKMVPGAGIEPARPLSRGILSPLCLPISPPGQRLKLHCEVLFKIKF